MKLSLTTPAVLFSAISLLLLAYTNRFLTIAQLVRNLHSKYKESRDQLIFGQLKNLRLRIQLIRNMQIFGIISLLLCVVCMFLIYIEWISIAEVIFGIALLLLIISLALSAWEIQISVKALNLHLSDIEEL
jgi:glucose uptake protein GlcU